MLLSDIADRTRLPIRTLRYVLDRDVLGRRRGRHPGRGVVRDFLPGEATELAVAAAMLEAGLRRGVAQALIAALMASPGPFRVLLTRATSRAGGVGNGDHVVREHDHIYIDFADRMNFRVRTEKAGSRAGAATALRPSSPKAAWRQVKTLAAVESSYRPMVVTTVDLTLVVDRLSDGAGGAARNAFRNRGYESY